MLDMMLMTLKLMFQLMGCRTYNGLDINAEPGTNPQTKGWPRYSTCNNYYANSCYEAKARS